MAQLNWPDTSRKRRWEEGPATRGFEEHRTKRLQSLPLRTLPTSRRIAPLGFAQACPTSAATLPGAQYMMITPGESDADNAKQQQQDRPEPQFWADCSGVTAQMTAQPPLPTWMHVDQDMDMIDSLMPHPESNAHGEAKPSHDVGFEQQTPCASNATVGRMPTPMHATFGAQIRGNHWSGVAGNLVAHHAAFKASVENMNVQQVCHAMGGHDCVPRSLGDAPGATEAIMQKWSLAQNRRLPSPISESGGEDSVLGSPGMLLECPAPTIHAHTNPHGYEHPMLAGLPPRAHSAIELDQTQRSPGLPRPTTPAVDARTCTGNAMDIEPQPVTASPKKGHSRSRHTLNSWTAAQPGVKKSFSIGYRADCEKCRLKVPGHFNHIIIS